MRCSYCKEAMKKVHMAYKIRNRMINFDYYCIDCGMFARVFVNG